MIKRPTFATHPFDEFWASGTSVLSEGLEGPALLCECASEHTAQGIADVLNYYNYIETRFLLSGPRPPDLKIVRD